MPNEFVSLMNLLNAFGASYTIIANGFGHYRTYRLSIYDENVQEIDHCLAGFGVLGSEEGRLETKNLGGCNGHETAEWVFRGWVKHGYI